MSIQAVGWALEQDLPARPKLVLVAICNHANHADGYCWLKAETIAREAACTPRSVYNFVGALVRNGFIRKELRKGEDGKQRSTDYWVLFDREEREWDPAANPDADEPESEASENQPSIPDAQDVVDRRNPMPAAEDPAPQERHDTRQPVEMSPRSCGPQESGFRRIEEEPSKINPKARNARARVQDRALRSYRPPPPQPMGHDLGTEYREPPKPLFVYEGTPAYEAWCKHRAREHGVPRWHLTTRALIDGQWRSGWYFPSLFPPAREPAAAATGPPIKTA